MFRVPVYIFVLKDLLIKWIMCCRKFAVSSLCIDCATLLLLTIQESNEMNVKPKVFSAE